MTTIVVPTPAGAVPAHLAIPDALADADAQTHPDGSRPGVVVIHEAFGLNHEIRGHADRFAGRGYLAVAPDLFSYGPRLRCIRDTFRSLLRREGPAFDVLDAVAGWFAAREDCTGRVGVIGYCMGGGFALLAAPRPAFAVASVNYGVVPKDAAELLRGACPVVGSYGAQDRVLRGAAGRLEAALTAAGVEHDVKEYPGAGHGFLNTHTGPLAVLENLMGAGYRPGPAQDAQRRIDDFFSQHLS